MLLSQLFESKDGFHVETYGGGKYTSVSWHPTKDEADAECKRIKDRGAWSGKPPRVTPGGKSLKEEKKHYIKSNGANIAGPFDTEDEAEEHLHKLMKRAKPEDELDDAKIVLEARGEYNSFKSWKAAVKKKHSDAWIEGDEDIAQAMVGPKPYKHGETKSVGEWDGSKGELFESLSEGEEDDLGGNSTHLKTRISREYDPVLKAHGFKKQPGGKYYKASGCGEITITKHGHWEHLHVGDSDSDKDYEGTTARTLDRHLKGLFMNEAKGAEGPRFRVSWKGYGKVAPKTVGMDFFDDDNGFDADDRAAIKGLGVQESHVTGGPRDSVTIVRIK